MDQMILKDSWLSVQDTAQNAVVQVIAQIAKFNWLEPYKVQEQGENRGTGFFIDKDGHLVTNAHVIDEATKVWVHLPTLGKKPIFVDVLSICPARDLALLRVQKPDLQFIKEHIGDIVPLPLGDSDLVHRTERVLVLGYPLGQPTMKSSTGVVSGRESTDGRTLIQITAPVNPGNSGGPLLNVDGEVIGIAISMVFRAQNIGYAIPINELKIILDDLYKQRFVRTETLGARFNVATDALASFLGNPLPTGLYINKVFEHSFMASLGVQEGDMLYEFNGFRIDGFGDATVPWSYDKIILYDLVSRLRMGDEVSMMIYRAGKRLDLKTKFSLSPQPAIRYRYPGFEPIEYEIFAGLVVMPLAENHIPYLIMQMPYLIDYTRPDKKLNPRLVITHIMPGSLSQQLRSLIPGFIVQELNGCTVSTIGELQDALRVSTETNYLTLKTSDNVFVALPFASVLEEEQLLAKTFSYPISPTMCELMA